MADLISVPLKKPSDVDIIKPLKNLIQSTYSTSDKPEDYGEALNELSRLRSSAIWKVFDKYETSLEVIYSYCDELTALEGKIPPQEVQIPFKWKDAFDKGSIFGGRMSLTICSLSYERVCVLFNIAALQSAVAAAQSTETDDGLKLAAKLFQQAAGIFNYLKANVVLAVHQETTPDLNTETLGALAQLMVAQAQEVFVHKAIHDDMKDAIIAKLASQCQELYGELVRTFQKESLRPITDKEWLACFSGKQAAFQAVAQYHQGLVCKASKQVGEQISRLQDAVENFKAAQSRSGRPTYFQEMLNKAQRCYNEVKKDNDFIYHERIPDAAQLEPIGKVLLAKATAIPDKWSTKFQDLFSNMVPVPVHQALAAYDVRKNEIVNMEINKLRESTQMLNSVLASLNLPASIEMTSGSELPQSILDKANAVRESGGLQGLEGLMRDMPDLLQRNKDILNESERMLHEERDADNQLRAQFGDKWVRTPSDKLTAMFTSNASKYRAIIDNAVSADRIVQEKFQQHREGIELLSKSVGELEAGVPTSASGGIKDSSAVSALRKLMEDVETIKAERDVIESELKSASVDMKAKFLSALAHDGAISEASISVTALGEAYGPLQKQVADSVSRQEKLIKDIQDTNSVFVAESGGSGGNRETKLCQLAAAHDAYQDLLSNLKEGTKFYNDLTQLLVVFQNKVSDYCFARKTEKEELLKDMTQESSRGGVPPTPTPPQHHTPSPTEPRREAPARPAPAAPQPGAPQASSLPYPTQGQSAMPVPYGAATSTPYPTYIPPPAMPQGYNPYGMPYPNSAAYPGFPQMPTYQSHPMQYPQQPGGQYPQQPGGQYPQQPGGQYPPQYPPQQYPPPQQYNPYQQQPPQW